MNCKNCGTKIYMINKLNLCTSHLLKYIDVQCAYDKVEEVIKKNPNIDENVLEEINNARNCLLRAMKLISK